MLLSDAIISIGVVLMGDKFTVLEEMGVQKCELLVGSRWIFSSIGTDPSSTDVQLTFVWKNIFMIT